ncbi:MAG: DUF934 domain-containing protein, partial [Stellaceae bacterium]
LPAARFLAEAEARISRGAETGVLWPNNRDIAELAPHLGRVAAVALVFPNFRDGRAYSQARLLRERYRYDGELRATGQVLRDQFLLMLRAGFDAFEVVKDADADHFADAVRRYSRFYQASVDRRPVIASERLVRDQPSEAVPVRAAS